MTYEFLMEWLEEVVAYAVMALKEAYGDDDEYYVDGYLDWPYILEDPESDMEILEQFDQIDWSNPQRQLLVFQYVKPIAYDEDKKADVTQTLVEEIKRRILRIYER